jgi:hypothetical protein
MVGPDGTRPPHRAATCQPGRRAVSGPVITSRPHATATRDAPARSGEVPPQPGPLRRLGALARFPLGLVQSTARYARRAHEVVRTEMPGGPGDPPPELPADLVDDRVKTLDQGAGPLFHRLFRVRVRDADLDAAGLVERLRTDLDRAAPSEVVSFRKQRGRLGDLEVGDEYRVRMPAPWDGPVRVVDRTPTSFRLATLVGHLEAGQIEFRARDAAGVLVFEIETWARPGDRVAAVVFDGVRVGKEIQLHMWTEFCRSVVAIAGGHRDGPVTADTRRVPGIR